MFVLLTVCEVENGTPKTAEAWFEKYNLFDQIGISNLDPLQMMDWAFHLIKKYNESEKVRSSTAGTFAPKYRHLVRCQEITQGEFNNPNFPVAK